MWTLFATDTPAAPLMVPDSVQKAKFAETVNRLMNLDFSEISRNLLSEALWV